jgi:plasmid maintenance system antidote protein VapI
MNIFEIPNYKDLIKYKVGLLKKVNSKYTFDSLANAMDVHKPYLSRVLNQKGDLSGDQIYKCSRYLKFSDLEEQYFSLVYEENISSLPERKSMLINEIEQIRRKAIKSDVLYSDRTEEIETSENYFLDPYFALIHMHLLVPKYKKKSRLDHYQIKFTKI